ncbi:hypothetical protein KPL42_17040 [Clostridium gasigenes]|uniref:hypothetical protein n=1 Tax=Clostridium gasigenes TaxID=94869 RepID=UPI001C0CACF0|nr:hypothetical protein [Clostridium gasigenes]MBU3090181.1 hypothetical protein [Clostridium gasigenes]
MLEPLKKWYCDTCGEIVDKPEDGYVQFKRCKENGLVYEDFVIVHHKTKSPLKNKRRDACYIYDSDSDLKSFLGDKGKVNLLSLLDPGPYHMPEFLQMTSNVRKWNDFFMRLQLPYYEEARRYLNRASSDGYFGDSNEVYIYMPESLKRMIEYYKNEDEI